MGADACAAILGYYPAATVARKVIGADPLGLPRGKLGDGFRKNASPIRGMYGPLLTLKPHISGIYKHLYLLQ